MALRPAFPIAVIAASLLLPSAVTAQAPQPTPTPMPTPTPTPTPTPSEQDEPSILDDSWLMVASGLFLGASTNERFDEVLRSRGYADAPRVWGGDVTVLLRTLDWLWIGGRLGLRARDWARTGQPSANAVGFGGMALAEARLRVNRAVDVGLTLGVGLGVIAFEMNDDSEAYPTPRLHVGAPLGFTLSDPARMFVRVGWDYMRATNFNDFGHDVNLSGASLAIGLEVRR